MFQTAEKRTAELIQQAGKSKPAAGRSAQDRRLLRRLHGTGAIEKRGLKPLQPGLRRSTRSSRAAVWPGHGQRLRADVDPINATNYHTEHLFGLFVTQGLEDPSHNIAYLLQGGLGMPSRDYYLSSDPPWGRCATSTATT